MELISPFEPGAQATSTRDLGGSGNDTGSQVMGKDEFLKLLVAQLSNQDPMNPLSGHEFAAQLAQFSSVEQLMNIGNVLSANGELNSMLAQSINSGVAAGLIGQTVEAGGNHIGWSGEGAAELGYELKSGASSVTITIRDEAGNLVRTINAGNKSSGKHTFDWDGKDRHGAISPSGAYTYEVNAVDAQDKAVKVETFRRGTIDRVTFGKEGILLWIGGASIPMQDVRSVE